MEPWLYSGGAAVAVIALVRFLLGDTGATRTLQSEIIGLRTELETERKERRSDHERMAQRIAQVELLYDTQRREKHRLGNELTKAQLLLGVIVDLAEKCSCGALTLVSDLMSRAATIGNPLDSTEES